MFVIELVALCGEKILEPRPENKILVLRRGSFSVKFPKSTPLLFMCDPPTPRGIIANFPFETGLQGIKVVVFIILDLIFVLMTTIIPCRQV